MGTIPVVCVADYQKMVETFAKDGDTYAGRYSIMAFEEIVAKAIGRDFRGIISLSGEKWREQRRFALHVLRDFGVGKNLMQDRVFDEMETMFGKINAKLEQNGDEEINLPELIDVAIGCIINSVMFGDRMDGDKESEFWEIKQLLNEHMQQVSEVKTLIWLMHPNLFSYVPIFSSAGRRLLSRLLRFYAFFGRRINEHHVEMEQSGGWEAPPRDFVDAFLKEMKRREAEDNGQNFNLGKCENVCSDLWTAGQETTAATLIWAVAFLLNNKECLVKLYAELDAVIGSDQLITVADKPRLPYTNAVINESLRMANLLAVNLMHATTRPVNLDGYELPEGTAILPQICAVFINEKHFPNAKLFNPDRYLDQNGKLKHCEELIPFSIGKRECPGRSLATMELFLFIANLFNKYKIFPGKVIPSLERKRAFIVHCLPYTCRVEKRNQGEKSQ